MGIIHIVKHEDRFFFSESVSEYQTTNESSVWYEVFMDHLQHHKRRLMAWLTRWKDDGMNHERIPVATLLSAG